MLYEYISNAVSQSPSCQNTKTVPDKKEEENRVKEDTVIPKKPTTSSWIKGMRTTPYPIPGMNVFIYDVVIMDFVAKPVASLLSIWTTQLNAKASHGHPEFRGRNSQTNKAELYSFMKNGAER